MRLIKALSDALTMMLNVHCHCFTLSLSLWCRSYQLPSEDFLLRHGGCHPWHRQLTKHPADQQTAESDMMVYETTYNWCCVQEWGRYWCTWHAEKIQIILGFQNNSTNLEDVSPNLKLHSTKGSDHGDNSADLLLPWEELISCYCAWRCMALWSFEVSLKFHF